MKTKTKKQKCGKKKKTFNGWEVSMPTYKFIFLSFAKAAIPKQYLQIFLPSSKLRKTFFWLFLNV
jgi:hypothetical protein